MNSASIKQPRIYLSAAGAFGIRADVDEAWLRQIIERRTLGEMGKRLVSAMCGAIDAADDSGEDKGGDVAL